MLKKIKIKKPLFVVIEGVDGSGKGTQSTLLKERLEKEGKKVLFLDYPRYNEKSSFMVKKYLNGEYGENIDYYTGSIGYSIDRLDDYLTNWKNNINNFDYIIANRYTTSNLIHQGSKIIENGKSKELIDKELKKYKNWLFDLEYKKLQLPKPDIVFYLDISLDRNIQNIDTRGNKKDIHENEKHLYFARESGIFWSTKLKKWNRIDCMKNKTEMKNIDEINNILIEYIL